MISAQAAGCAPIVVAFEQHRDSSEFFTNASTLASGLRVPKPLGDFLILADLYASHGEAVPATDAEMLAACRDMAALEGIFAAPEGGAGLVAAAKLLTQDKIRPDDTVVLFNTGSGYKYLEAWHTALEKN
jgi:threonine synthase